MGNKIKWVLDSGDVEPTDGEKTAIPKQSKKKWVLDSGDVEPTDGEKTAMPKQRNAKRRAGLLDRFAVGLEEGVTPFVAGSAIKGTMGMVDKAKQTENGMQMAGNFAQGAFDPNYSLYSKMANVDFDEETPGFTGVAANFAGNVLGSAGKTLATGGLGGVDAGLQLGAKIAKVAPSLAKLIGYETAKQGVATLGATGLSKITGGGLEYTDWYQNLSDKDKEAAMTLLQTGSGMAGGAGAGKGVSHYGIQKITPLRTLRDKAVAGTNIKTYADIDRANKIKEIEPDLVDTLELKDKNLEPTKQPKPLTPRGEVKTSQEPMNAKQFLDEVNDYHYKVGETSVGAKDAIHKSIGDKITLGSEDKNVKQLQNVIGSAQSNTPTTPVSTQLTAKDYKPINSVKTPAGTTIQRDDKGNLVLHVEDMNNTLKTPKDYVSDIQHMIDAHNKVIDKKKGTNQLTNLLQQYFNEVGNAASDGKLTKDERIGYGKRIINNLFTTGGKGDYVEYAQQTYPNVQWFNPDGTINAKALIKQHNHEFGDTGFGAQNGTGTSISGLIDLHKPVKTDEYYNQYMGEITRQLSDKTASDQGIKVINDGITETGNHFYETLKKYGGYNDNGQVDDLMRSVTNKFGDNIDTMSWHDSNAPIEKRIASLRNLSTIMRNVSGLMKTEAPEGYAHGGKANILQFASKDLNDRLIDLYTMKAHEKNMSEKEVKEYVKKNMSTILDNDRNSLFDNKGNEIKLRDNANLVTHSLIQATEHLFDNNKTHPYSIIEGSNVSPSSWLGKFDKLFKNVSTNGLNIEGIAELITTVNKAEISHANLKPELQKLKKQLKKSREDLIRKAYGDNVEGAENVINQYNKIDRLQAENIKSKGANPLTDSSYKAMDNADKSLDGTEAFKLSQIDDLVRSIAPNHGLVGKGYALQKKQAELAKQTGKFEEFRKTQHNIHLNEGLGKPYYHETYQDLTPVKDTTIEGVTLGKPNKTKLEGLNQQAKELNDIGLWKDKETRDKVAKELMDNIYDETNMSLEKYSKQAIVGKVRNKPEIDRYRNISNALGEMHDNIQHIHDNYPELKNLLENDGRFDHIIKPMSRKNSFMENMMNNAEKDISSNKPNLLQNVMKSFSGAKDTQQLKHVLDSIDRTQMNILEHFKKLYPHDKIADDILTHEEGKDYKPISQHKKSMLEKIVGLALFKAVGIHRALGYGVQEGMNYGRSKKQIEGNMMIDIAEALRYPLAENPQSGRTYKEDVKDYIKQAEKLLKKPTTKQKVFGHEYRNTYTGGKIGYTPMYNVGMMYNTPDEEDDK